MGPLVARVTCLGTSVVCRSIPLEHADFLLEIRRAWQVLVRFSTRQRREFGQQPKKKKKKKKKKRKEKEKRETDKMEGFKPEAVISR